MLKRQQQIDPVATHKSLSLEEAVQLVKKRGAKMTDAERVQTLKDAGILTASGRLAKPYRGVFPKKAQGSSDKS